MKTDLVTLVVVIACAVLVFQRVKHRFGAFGSLLVKPPAYRVLFLLVLVGALLVSLAPEAALVLPALDAVGLDLVTILVALELRHYLSSVGRLARVPTWVRVLRWQPALGMYACVWPLIWARTIMGKM